MKKITLLAALAALSASPVFGGLFIGNQGGDCCPDARDTQWYVEADFLWWKAVEDSLPVAVVTDTTDGAVSVSVLNPNFKWDPGFRLGVGYTPCGCDWDFYASWTHFDTKAKRSFGPGSATETVVPQWGAIVAAAGDTTTLSSHWHLHLNWADFELNHNFCESECFKFGVHGGLRAVWINQKFNFALTDTGAGASTDVSSKSDYSSLGVVAGLEASWRVGCGISINACAGGAILYGRQKSRVSETFTTTTALDISGSSHYYISRAMSDLRLGISWETSFFDCYNFVFEADWEHHILFCQNQFPRGSVTASSRPRDGDLTIQGATFSATLFF